SWAVSASACCPTTCATKTSHRGGSNASCPNGPWLRASCTPPICRGAACRRRCAPFWTTWGKSWGRTRTATWPKCLRCAARPRRTRRRLRGPQGIHLQHPRAQVAPAIGVASEQQHLVALRGIEQNALHAIQARVVAVHQRIVQDDQGGPPRLLQQV